MPQLIHNTKLPAYSSVSLSRLSFMMKYLFRISLQLSDGDQHWPDTSGKKRRRTWSVSRNLSALLLRLSIGKNAGRKIDRINGQHPVGKRRHAHPQVPPNDADHQRIRDQGDIRPNAGLVTDLSAHHPSPVVVAPLRQRPNRAALVKVVLLHQRTEASGDGLAQAK
mmetsp:Transcript_37744/g.64405  ORF Transcript_37744/g.64405 Transcript_37744/m.64405 type:complete len:166 (-) Transcript_37744:1541-2038(-)